jgi:hypothetical protein
MLSGYLSESCKITPAILPSEGVAAATDLEGATLDMAGFDGVLMVVTFGAITANAVTAITAQQGALSNASDMTNLAGTGQTIADDDDDLTFYIDLQRPTERYVRLHVDRATQNAVVASATYIQYKARNVPVTHADGVAGETHATPAEGTA